MQARSALGYGTRPMNEVNAGKATIVGSDGTAYRSDGSQGGGGRSIGELHVHLAGIFDVTDKRGLRRVAEALRDEMIELERAYR